MRLLAFLVLVHVHPIASDSCPSVFHQLNLLDVDAILVLIDMDEHVADAGHGIGQGWNCCRLNVQRLVAGHEE